MEKMMKTLWLEDIQNMGSDLLMLLVSVAVQGSQRIPASTSAPAVQYQEESQYECTTTATLFPSLLSMMLYVPLLLYFIL